MTSDRAKDTIEELIKQEPISDNDRVVFMIVGTPREEMTNIHGEPMQDECDESVLTIPYPPNFPLGAWLSIAEGITYRAVYEPCHEQHVIEHFDRIIADPDTILEFRTVALKVYKETSRGNAQGFQMQWEFVADLVVHHND
jgi:hypothetical protein